MFVFFAIDNVLGWFVAIIIGAIVGAVAVTAVKQLWPRKTAVDSASADSADAPAAAAASA